MSSLSNRIRGIVMPGPKGPGLRTDESVADEGVGRVLLDPASVLGGIADDGCIVIEREWKPSARHGREEVASLAQRVHEAGEDAPLLAGGAPARAPFVFFDLETTGLNGGAGTHAFLVGSGWFDGDRFVTRQFLMARYGDERALLARVASELSRAGALVSFNGKSFDAPLLETRYLFHRLPWFGDRLPHVDVLHPARQFWRRDDCSLGSLERQLIGCRRSGDVDGFEIPARYFQFVRTADARPLVPVLDHNRLDLLSLAALTARLLDMSRKGPAAVTSAREALALGHVYGRAGFDARSRDAYGKAIAMSRAPQGAFDATKIEALRALAGACRRARLHEEAVRCWQALLEIRGCPAQVAFEAGEALAIHHEHRVHDLEAARTFALQSVDQTEGKAKRKDALDHRLARLGRKMKVSERRQSLSSSLPLSYAAPMSERRTSS